MGHILCSDLFNIYTSYIPYQERPKLLHINKQIHSLYTKYFLTKDKQTFSNLKDILNNEEFFNIIFGPNHQPFIKSLNNNDINTLHEYSYKKRQIKNVKNIHFIICPYRLASYICHHGCFIYPNKLLTLLIMGDSQNELSYIDLKNRGIRINDIQIFTTNKTEFIYEFGKYDPIKYKGRYIVPGKIVGCIENANFLYDDKWKMFVKEMQDPTTIQTLNIIENYNTYIKKIEM
jgi:hypothetical protein